MNTRYSSGQVRGVAGGRQAGFVFAGGNHAAVWAGSADSLIDLNPPGYVSSIIAATNGRQHAGSGSTPDGRAHVLVWDESGQVTDLTPLIPPNNDNLPMIAGIDSLGNVVGTIGIGGVPHAFMLVPVPEPGGLGGALAVAAGAATLPRRRRG